MKVGESGIRMEKGKGDSSRVVDSDRKGVRGQGRFVRNRREEERTQRRQCKGNEKVLCLVWWTGLAREKGVHLLLCFPSHVPG